MGFPCCVKNCYNKSSTYACKNLSFHSFPPKTDSALRKKWLNILRMNEDDLLKYKHPKVCSVHFQPSEVKLTGSIKRLRKNVIPSIFPSAGSYHNLQIIPIEEPLLVSTSNDVEIIKICESPSPMPTEDPLEIGNHPLKIENDLLRKKIQEMQRRIIFLERQNNAFKQQLTEGHLIEVKPFFVIDEKY